MICYVGDVGFKTGLEYSRCDRKGEFIILSRGKYRKGPGTIGFSVMAGNLGRQFDR